jgi:toxin ParE1/3/4
MRELARAIDFYADQATGLAEDLLGEVDAAVERIAELPDAGAPYHHGTRRILLRRFPYALIYRRRAQDAEVVAVAHQRRRPDYWAD